MTISNVNPISGSIIDKGTTLSVTNTIGESVTLITHKRTGTGGVDEIVWTSGGGYQAAYTGGRVLDGAEETFTFRRNAGFDSSPFQLEFATATTTSSITYLLVAEGEFPEDMQPFNDPIVGTGQEITVRDSGVLVGAASEIDFYDNLTVTNLGAGAVRVDAAPVEPFELEIRDQTVTVAAAADSIDFRGTGVTATAFGNNAIVTVPGEFTALSDTPGTYAGAQGMAVVVNDAATGLAFRQQEASVGDVQSLTVNASGVSNTISVDLSALPSDCDLEVTFELRLTGAGPSNSELLLLFNDLTTSFYQGVTGTIDAVGSSATGGAGGYGETSFSIGYVPGTSNPNVPFSGKITIPDYKTFTGLGKSFFGVAWSSYINSVNICSHDLKY